MAFPSPSLVPPTLSNWQFSISGYTMGAGTAAGMLEINGIGDLAPIRSGDVARSRDHGEIIGLDLYGGRDITLNIWAKTDGTSLQDTLSNLAAATLIGLTTEQPLWFQLPNYPLLCAMVRPRKRVTPIDAQYSAAQIAMPVAQFHATDPRLYTAGSTMSVSLGNPAAGATFPLHFPISFGSTGPNGVTITNSGNTEMRPTLLITGPCTNPSVINATITGSPTLTFTNPNQTSYTVLSGDQMVVDLDFQTVLYYSGGVSAGNPAAVPGWVVSGSTWWDLLPGGNLIQYTSSDSVSVSSTCVLSYASAYML